MTWPVHVHYGCNHDDGLAQQLREVIDLLHQVANKENMIMAQVQVAQEDLDALSTALTADDAALAAAIAALEAKVGQPLAAGDLTALKAAVDATAALVPTPVTPPPAPASAVGGPPTESTADAPFVPTTPTT